MIKKLLYCFCLILLFLFLLPIKSKAQPPGRECANEVMLILDESGSMWGAIEDVKDAAKYFVDKLMENPDLKNRAGVVWYESSARKPIGLSYDKDAIKAAIDTGSAGGTTNMTAGINLATNELTTNSDPGVPLVIIHLTDGNPNNSGSAKNAFDNAKAAGIRVFNIGLGSGVNDSFLSSNASQDCPTAPYDPPACYWPAPSTAELDDIYNTIFMLIADRDGDGFIDERCGGDDTLDTTAQGPCVNPNSKEEAKYGVAPDDCDDAASVAALFDLRDPDGNLRPDYVCNFKYYGYDCNGVTKGICALGCEDGVDNDQDGLVDTEEKGCVYLTGGLVPCGRRSDAPATPEFEFCPCRLCHLIILTDRVIDFLITKTVFPLGILMIAVGGIMFVTAGGNPQRVANAKKIITTTVLGVVIILGAWLIVNTVLMLIGVADWTGLETGWWKINCPVPNICNFKLCDGNPCFLPGEPCP